MSFFFYSQVPGDCNFIFLCKLYVIWHLKSIYIFNSFRPTFHFLWRLNLLLMHNIPKWSNTLYKSCSKCCKILKDHLTTLGRYLLCKGLMTFCNIQNSPINVQFVNPVFRESTTVPAFAAEAILVERNLAIFIMLINCCY